ncbi:MAG: c-type cytochrome [Deltaproteobacteria bacterium]|nr:c-type cytochrome [Deltaproteobacteria bacterium]
MPEKIGHSVDGIEEYDNPIPRWLMWLLYFTVIFSFVYWILYPGFWSGASGWNQAHMYEEEVELASVKYAAFASKAEDLNSLVNNPKAIAEGKEIFAQNCSPCHGADAHGAIGPNLTDKDWIYGGTPQAIAKTVTDGTANGMPTWKSQLGSLKIADVAVYVHSLGGGQ